MDESSSDSTQVSWRRSRVLDAMARISFVLVALGSMTPALYMRRDDGGLLVLYGISPLLVGWVGICGMQFAWFANLLLLWAWKAMRNDDYGAARRRLWIALALAANTFAWFFYSVPNDEGTNRMLRLERLGIGFYFWIAAIVLPLVAIYWAKSGRRKIAAAERDLGKIDAAGKGDRPT